MSIEKTLLKIKIKIGEISESMQSFADETIHPPVAECDQLRNQMNELLEQLAVYKYLQINKEISPSFNLHAKLSEKVSVIEEIKTIIQEEKEPEPIPVPEPIFEPKLESAQTETVVKSIAPLGIGLNDKFRLINELFSQNSAEYNIVLEQLNNLKTWQETDLYLNSLKTVYNWKDSNESVKYFFSIIRKRFD